MTLDIGRDRITSPDSAHVAVRCTLTQWRVTWLRETWPPLTRNQAINAMMIAAVVGSMDELPRKSDQMWGHLVSWSSLIGINPQTAISYVTDPPQWKAG